MNKEEIEKDIKFTASIPILTQEEINGIDMNMNEFINQFTKMIVKEKDLVIAQYIIKKQEDKIEGFLRSLIFKILYGKEDNLKHIIVTDLKSTDKTKEIAKKLSYDYECLKVLSWRECKDIMDNVDDS